MFSFSRRSRPIDRRLTILAPALALVLLAPPVRAQSPVQRADELLRSGRVMAAESLYYAAVSLTPRDPHARHALGRYLVARGRLKIGATLMEEARFFGGDVKIAALDLAPVYAAMHDYRSLAALQQTPLTGAERQRVIWLRDHPPVVTGADSSVVRLHPGSGSAIARIPVTIAGEPVVATIDPTVRGLLMDTTWLARAGIKRFPISSGGDVMRMPLVAQEVAIGDLTLQNVSAKAQGQPGVVIGLDVLGQLTPTFDSGAEVLIVRRGRRIPRARGERLPTVVREDGWHLAHGQRLLSLHGADARGLLDGRRWTLHARRGEVVLER